MLSRKGFDPKCHIAIKRCRCKLFREVFLEWLFILLYSHWRHVKVTQFWRLFSIWSNPQKRRVPNQFASTLHPNGKNWEQSVLNVPPNWKYSEIRLTLNVNYKWKQRKNYFFCALYLLLKGLIIKTPAAISINHFQDMKLKMQKKISQHLHM